MSEPIIKEAKKCLANVPIELVSQGAEALVFITETHPYLPKETAPSGFKHSKKYVIKYRPKKPYRHPKLDSQITKHRTISEAKFLVKLNSLNIKAPRLISLDAPNGIIWMEFIGDFLPNGDISSLKNWLWYLERTESEDPVNEATRDILMAVGKEVGDLHMSDMVHGDLTSSNIILQKNGDKWAPILIDFGLGSYSGLAEDKAVDLYVLERALLSTHPVYAEQYNVWLLEGYKEAHKTKGKVGNKKAMETLKRLEDVRMRGRKRSMLG